MSETNQDNSIFHHEKQIIGGLKIIHYIGMVFIFAMMVLTAIHVVGRYLLNKPVPGTIELSTYFMVSGVFLAIGYTMVMKGHRTVGLIIDRLSEKGRLVMESFGYICCLVVVFFAAWHTFGWSLYINDVGKVSTILGIPQAPFLIITCVGWGFFGLASALNLAHSIHRMVRM